MIDFAAATDRATPGVERAVIGEWTVRAAFGETGRANSARPHGDPGCTIPEAVDRVEAFYRARAMPAIFQVFDEAPVPLTAELDQRGYDTGAITDILSSPVVEIRERVRASPELQVDLTDAMPPFLADQLSASRAAEMQSTSLPTVCALASRAGETVGGGMAILDGELVGLFAMRTHPLQQGRGVGTAVIAGLLDAGTRAGTTIAWLQVEASNHRAADWYRRLGLERPTGYRYRRRVVWNSPDRPARFTQ